MKECCDVLNHNYVDPASIYRILFEIRPDLDPSRIQIHWIRPDPEPDIRPDPDLDPVHPYLGGRSLVRWGTGPLNQWE